ncbi:MAG: hypothetical protein ACOC3V_00450 [bacterium]
MMDKELKIIANREIQFDYQDFYIAFNVDDNYWYAYHYDEETYGSDYLLIDTDLLKEESINLYNNFVLDFEEFQELNELKNKFLKDF